MYKALMSIGSPETMDSRLLAALRVVADSEEIKVDRGDDDIEVSIDGIGKANGTYAHIDEDSAFEGFPLGLDSYGEKVAQDIYKQIDDLDMIFYVETIEIDPTVRKKGYGKLLLEKLEEEAKKKDIDALMGNASPFGHGAKRVPFSTLKKFYTKMGYEFLHVYDNQNGLILKRT